MVTIPILISATGLKKVSGRSVKAEVSSKSMILVKVIEY